MRQQRFLKVPKKSHVYMHISTWNKDSHGLYDFDSSPENYEEQELYIDRPVSIFRNFQEKHSLYKVDQTVLHEKSSKRQVDPTLSFIGSILVDKKQDRRVFKFQSQIKKQSNFAHHLYEVYRQTDPENPTNPGYMLKPGTIIKLGRVEFIVLEIKTNQQIKRFRQTNLYQEGNGIYQAKFTQQAEKNQVNCKICCCNEQSEENPLISPCLCKGSCALIHLGCLRQWITSKVRKETGTLVNSYNFTKFQCQLCKHPFPRMVKNNGKEYEMMKIGKPETRPYIILQSLPKTPNEERCLHLIEGKDSGIIRIGRNYQSEIRITDISVSRAHSQIIYKDGNFIIRDQKSKFGTLIRLTENELQLSSKTKSRIQLGRVLYELQVKSDHEQCDTQ